MKFRVRTLPRAEADIRGIAGYIHKRSPPGAAAWMNAYERTWKRLVENAADCGEADENEFLDVEVKQSLFKTSRGRVYRLLFTIVADEVRILRVRGSGQAPVDPDNL